ncbi:BrnT family toxin [Cupriavidus sp. 8B]
MEITFDPNKDAANIAKHGVSPALSAEIEWSEVMVRPDTRRDYSELREIGFGLIGDRLYCVVFTQRGETLRIISLRKANSKEIRDVQES